MPKLKEVKVGKSYIEWSDISVSESGGSLKLSLPRREHLIFIETGWHIKNMRIEYEKNEGNNKN